MCRCRMLPRRWCVSIVAGRGQVTLAILLKGIYYKNTIFAFLTGKKDLHYFNFPPQITKRPSHMFQTTWLPDSRLHILPPNQNCSFDARLDSRTRAAAVIRITQRLSSLLFGIAFSTPRSRVQFQSICVGTWSRADLVTCQHPQNIAQSDDGQWSPGMPS